MRLIDVRGMSALAPIVSGLSRLRLCHDAALRQAAAAANGQTAAAASA